MISLLKETYFNKISLLVAFVSGGLLGAAGIQRALASNPSSLSDLAALVAVGWIAIMTAVTFVAFLVDKAKAKLGTARISENALFWMTALGGFLGALLGMAMVRHKTRKGSFRLRFWMITFFFASGLIAGAIACRELLGSA